MTANYYVSLHSEKQSIMNTDKKITRRNALKLLGASAISIAAASSGLLSLASCGTTSKRRIIFYFTGTGNCLHIARELADDNTELLSIPQLIKEKKLSFEAEEIGIVYPIYGHMPPNMVRRFIEKAELKADYTFAVLTYGMRHCNAVELWDDIARKAGTRFHYISTIVMVDNWLPNFDMNEQMKMDKHIPENVAKIKADLKARKHWHEPVTQEERDQHAGFMEYTGIDPNVGFLMKAEDSFEVAGACIECGVCTYVCPRGNWKLGHDGAQTQGDCEFCFACIQNCPQKAIQFVKHEGAFPDGSEKNPNARYRNEHISLMDLKRANNQL